MEERSGSRRWAAKEYSPWVPISKKRSGKLRECPNFISQGQISPQKSQIPSPDTASAGCVRPTADKAHGCLGNLSARAGGRVP